MGGTGIDFLCAADFDELVIRLRDTLGLTVYMVTHDLDTLARLATRIAVLADQRIIVCGTPAEVLATDHPFIQNFFCSEHARAVMQKN